MGGTADAVWQDMQERGIEFVFAQHDPRHHVVRRALGCEARLDAGIGVHCDAAPLSR